MAKATIRYLLALPTAVVVGVVLYVVLTATHSMSHQVVLDSSVGAAVVILIGFIFGTGTTPIHKR